MRGLNPSRLNSTITLRSLAGIPRGCLFLKLKPSQIILPQLSVFLGICADLCNVVVLVEILCTESSSGQNRWILVEFIPIVQGTAQLGKYTVGSANAIHGKAIWSVLKQSVLNNFGEAGWGAVGLSLTVKYFSPTTNICIIRVARDQHNVAWGALTLLTSIEGTRYLPNVVHVSGTIRHAQLAAIAHNREVIARYRALAKNPAAYQDSYNTFLENTEREIEALQD